MLKEEKELREKKSKLLDNIRGLKTIANVLDTGTTDRLVREFEHAVRTDEREKCAELYDKMRLNGPQDSDAIYYAIREGKEEKG